MMINKRLIAMMGDSKRYIARNGAAMGGAVGQYCHDLCRVCVFGGACVRPGQSVRRAACAAGCARRAVLLHPGRGFDQLQRQPHREKTLRAAIYEKLLRLGGSYAGRAHRRGPAAGGRGRRTARDLLRRVPSAVFLRHARAPHTVYRAGPGQPAGSGHFDDLRAADSGFHRGCAEICQKLLGKYWGQYAALGDSFLENLQGLTTLKIYQADEARHAAMNRDTEHFRKVTMKVLTMQLNSIIVMDVIAYGGAALGIAVAAKEFAAGRVGLQGALCILLLSADFFLPMRALGSYFHVAMNGMAASDKIFKLLDLPEGDARTAEIGTGCAIACRDLHFGYTVEKETLHGLNLDFPQGSFTALVGESGCGKSTIAAVLTGRAAGYTGGVTIGGQELSTVNEANLFEKRDPRQSGQPPVQGYGGRQPADGRTRRRRRRTVGRVGTGQPRRFPAQRGMA